MHIATPPWTHCVSVNGCYCTSVSFQLSPWLTEPVVYCVLLWWNDWITCWVCLSSIFVGVPGCSGQAYGEGWQKGQAGSVDQRLRGRTGMSHVWTDRVYVKTGRTLRQVWGKETGICCQMRSSARMRRNLFSVRWRIPDKSCLIVLNIRCLSSR